MNVGAFIVGAIITVILILWGLNMIKSSEGGMRLLGWLLVIIGVVIGIITLSNVCKCPREDVYVEKYEMNPRRYFPY